MVIFGDLTQAHPGSIASVLSKVPPAVIERNDFSVIVDEGQVTEVPPTLKRHVVQPGTSAGSCISGLLNATLPGESIAVLSFNSYALRQSLHVEPGRQVLFRNWAKTSDLVDSASPTPHPPKLWPLRSITLEEGVAALARVLTQHQAFTQDLAVYKSALRPLLDVAEPRLAKAATGKLPVMSMIIDAGVRSGLLHSDRGGISERVWMAQPFHATPPLRVELVTPETPATPESRTVADDRFKSSLRKSGLGPFPNFREPIYDAIEQSLKDSITSQSLIRKAVSTVSKAHSEHKNFSWNSVNGFITKLCTRCPVFLGDDGSEVRPTLDHLSTKVAAVKDGWRETLDGELVLALLQDGCEISMYDFPALAGAIYLDRENDNLEKLDRVVSRLHSSGKIRYDAGGSEIVLT